MHMPLIQFNITEMITDTLNVTWVISMLQKSDLPFLAGKNKWVFHSFLVIKINPNYSPPTQHTESHNVLSLPLGEVRRLTGSLCGKSHLLFESKQPFPHPQTQSLRLPLSSKMS